jgi:5-methylcytosine-specific restriction endonuclease McrA
MLERLLKIFGLVTLKEHKHVLKLLRDKTNAHASLKKINQQLREKQKFNVQQVEYERFKAKKVEARQKTSGWCIYCGVEADTVDHMIPKSRGGTDDVDNLIPACRACNQEKGDRTYDEYVNWRAKWKS